MGNKKKKIILSQMFDVRPVDKTGALDLEKIRKVQRILRIEREKTISSTQKEKIKTNPSAQRPVTLDLKAWRIERFSEKDRKLRVYQFGKLYDTESVPVTCQAQSAERFLKNGAPGKNFEKDFKEKTVAEPKPLRNFDYFENDKRKELADQFSFFDIFTRDYFFHLEPKKIIFPFSALALLVFLFISGAGFFSRGMKIKASVLGKGKEAYVNLAQAKEGILNKDFQKSSLEFNESHLQFNEISEDLNDLGTVLVGVSRFFPYFSKISSGKYLAEAGKDVSKIGMLFTEVIKTLDDVKNPLKEEQSISFLKVFQDTDKNLTEILELLDNVQKNLSKVNIDDIPADQREKFLELRSKLPQTKDFIAGFLENSQIFTDVLGGNGPRKYLFLFQNNQERRATGGFIGTYGILDIFNGRIRKFFIDGIYNPDGQLREKVIPPIPIQKISAAWSLHDSNWFPDFPTSAEKATWFYEKTGGPTVDGVIAMTPTVMEKLLEITGPIEMPEYGVVVDKDNFVEKIQYEVEVDYDKETNEPKKILADLAPEILDRIFNAHNFSDIAKTLNVLAESLSEKQILIYSRNYEVEKKLSEAGWSGEILDTQKDYLSVINTNINGFKTDGVVDENIDHVAEIQEDGSVIDTVTITRRHNGGNARYDWWNKVNADYLRVYVPKGSVLLNAEGQTREFNSPPLDYGALGFRKDPQVQMEEDSVRIDEESGTRIYDDAGKTVFANWVYVSPQETVQVKYRYLLPFKISFNSTGNPADTYSLLAQKQAGSPGSKFSFQLIYPGTYKMIWKYPDKDEIQTEDVSDGKKKLEMKTDLVVDRFTGVAFVKE